MDVQINEMSSTVRTMDSQSLLHPHVIEEIMRLAVRRVREDMEHEKRVQAERRLEPGVSEPESPGQE